MTRTRALAQLAGFTEAELLALHRVGSSAVRILELVMAELEVRFRR
jgi:hypothetical protein